jgi:hypothetical protein
MTKLQNENEFDVVIIGATPGGIASAISAARNGASVALVERHNHVGGMSASGLGKSDIEEKGAVGGLFREFVEHVRDHYAEVFGIDSEAYALCRDGYYYEPSVAEKIFNRMLSAEASIRVMTNFRLESAGVDAGKVCSVVVKSTTTASVERTIVGKVFIDATYEGDLIARAGAGYHLGREARAEYGEPHAGQIFYNYHTGEILDEGSGAGDDNLPAYTYRLFLSSDPSNSVPLDVAPDGYDRSLYLPYLEDLAAGRLSAPASFKEGRGYYPEHFDTLVRALSVTDMPNRKVDANINPRPLAFPFVGENYDYIEADWSRRETIEARHKSIALGLLWFLQNDEVVPASHREMVRKYQLPADEFTDAGHFPWQLYVREGRRLKGQYTLTEHDVAETAAAPEVPVFDDSIAVGEFPIDSFPVQKISSSEGVVLEGYLGMLDHITRLYSIPYRVMLPEHVKGLLAAVPISATHVAFSSIRMEPTWMALGQAAGTAAALCVQLQCEPEQLSVSLLRGKLQDAGQVLDVYALEHSAFK